MDLFRNNLQNFSSFPRLTKTIAISLFVFLLLGLTGNKTIISLFTLNVSRIAPPYFYLWTLITANFFETSIITGIFNIIFLLFIGKYLEPIWGSKEFIKFIGIVSFFASLCSFFSFIFLFMITGKIYLVYNSEVCGFSGLIAAFSVALKQLIPEQEFSIFTLKLRAKHLPSILILIRVVLFIFIGFNDKSISLVLFGVLISWIYLRFYQVKSGIKGDLNESFSFYTFFPEPMHPAVSKFSNIIFKLLCKLSLCSSSRFSNSSILPTSSTSSFSDNNNNDMSYSTADMERRRALAVKALEERMQQQQQRQPNQQQQTQTQTQQQTQQNNNNNNLNISIDQEPNV